MLKTHNINGYSLDNEMRFFLSYVPSLTLIVSKGFTSISNGQTCIAYIYRSIQIQTQKELFHNWGPLFYYGNLFKILSKGANLCILWSMSLTLLSTNTTSWCDFTLNKSAEFHASWSSVTKSQWWPMFNHTTKLNWCAWSSGEGH